MFMTLGTITEFMTLGTITDADKIMNPQHSGHDPADVWIGMWINLEIWIQIPDHLWFRLDCLAEICAL